MISYERQIESLRLRYEGLPEWVEVFFREYYKLQSCPVVKLDDLSGQSITSMITECLRSLVDPSKKTVALFYDRHAWSQIGDDVPEWLREAGYNVLFLTLAEKRTYIPGFLPVDRAVLQAQDVLSCCIGCRLPTWLTCADTKLSNVPVIGISRTARTFYDPDQSRRSVEPPAVMAWGEHAILPVYDRATFGGTYKITNFRLPRDVLGGRSRTYVWPLVPNKIDRIKSLARSMPEDERRAILVCPTTSNLKEYFVEKHGLQILHSLIELYPDRPIVFRPRPEERSRPEVKNITERLSGFSNFKFDCVDDFTTLYAKAAILITDRSSTGQTFTLATSRPSLYFPLNDGVDGITIKELRGKGCFRVKSVPELLRRCDEFLHDIERVSSDIAPMVKGVYDANYSFEDRFLQYLDHAINETTSPEWLKIEIPDSNLLEASADGYEESLASIVETGMARVEIYGFNLIDRYLSICRAEERVVPDALLKNLTKLYLEHFQKDHSTYHLIGRVVRLILHNYSLSFSSENTYQCLKSCERVIVDRGYRPAIDEFYVSVAECPAANACLDEMENKG